MTAPESAQGIDPGLVDEMTGWRHDFHQHPELGFDEHRTSARIAELLRDFGLEVHTGIGGTGVSCPVPGAAAS